MINIDDEDLDDVVEQLALHSCDFIAHCGLDDEFDYINFDAQMFFEVVGEEKLIDYFQKLMLILAQGYMKTQETPDTKWQH